MHSKLIAQYFDGQSAAASSVEVWAQSGVLFFTRDGQLKQISLADLRIREPSGSAPRVIQVASGGHFELPAGAALEALLDELGHRDSWVNRLQSKLRYGLLAVGLLVAAVALFYVHGLPKVSEVLAQHIPVEMVQKLDESALAHLDQHAFQGQKSTISESRREVITQQFEALLVHLRQQPDFELDLNLDYQLVFRSMGGHANAMALPGGTLILLDGLVDKLNNQEVLAVLAHEIGHVAHRHSLSQIVQGALLGVSVAFLTGDVSTLTSLVIFQLYQLQMNRGMEYEADDFSVRALASAGLSVEPLLTLHEKLQTLSHTPSDAPDSGRTDYLSTHPSGQKRIERIRDTWRAITQDPSLPSG